MIRTDPQPGQGRTVAERRGVAIKPLNLPKPVLEERSREDGDIPSQRSHRTPRGASRRGMVLAERNQTMWGWTPLGAATFAAVIGAAVGIGAMWFVNKRMQRDS